MCLCVDNHSHFYLFILRKGISQNSALPDSAELCGQQTQGLSCLCLPSARISVGHLPLLAFT